MTSLLFTFAAAIAAGGLIRGQEAYTCDHPAAGCKYGIFNQVNCTCECIPPFCPDDAGLCSSSLTCDNPWEDCVRGVNCPWWTNTANADSCATGPSVPPGIWNVYNTEDFCCKANFPYSETCYLEEGSESPTKYPSIVAPDDETEIVPIRFDVFGLSQNIDMDDLRDELKTVTTRVVLRLAEDIQGLKISKVEERAGGITDNPDGGKSMYFNIYAIRNKEKKFAPLIVQAIRDSYGEVVEQIYTFTDTYYFTEDVSINICALQNGKYEACAKEEPTSTPTTSLVIPPPSANVDEGLAGWAISLIVIFVLSFVCCVGYAIAVVCFGVANCFDDCFRDHDDTKKIQNNIYFDDRSRDDRSPVSRLSRNVLAIENGNWAPENKDSSTIVRYPRSVKSHENYFIQRRDPTMYIPGQEDKPDPYSESGWSDSGPPLKSKRDPTMYLDGESYDGDLPVKPTRDPTMYDDGHRETDIFDESTAAEFHNDFHGVDKNIGKVTRDRSYYDMAASELSFFDDVAQRFDESRSIKSAGTKKSTKSKKDTQKSSQSADWNASNKDDIYEPKKRASLRASLESFYNTNASINDDHANSYADRGSRGGVKDTRRTKSYYK
ncbi:hypothetical protein ACHAXA_007078 [Cyclostephanos tholiformis]|uniref:Uncharacterized protein n=1 Tax=Cyclostephanos tholiformis TaxID=382380 RepID=A0ABD3RZ46_9STRA